MPGRRHAGAYLSRLLVLTRAVISTNPRIRCVYAGHCGRMLSQPLWARSPPSAPESLPLPRALIWAAGWCRASVSVRRFLGPEQELNCKGLHAPQRFAQAAQPRTRFAWSRCSRPRNWPARSSLVAVLPGAAAPSTISAGEQQPRSPRWARMRCPTRDSSRLHQQLRGRRVWRHRQMPQARRATPAASAAWQKSTRTPDENSCSPQSLCLCSGRNDKLMRVTMPSQAVFSRAG